MSRSEFISFVFIVLWCLTASVNLIISSLSSPEELSPTTHTQAPVLLHAACGSCADPDKGMQPRSNTTYPKIQNTKEDMKSKTTRSPRRKHRHVTPRQCTHPLNAFVKEQRLSNGLLSCATAPESKPVQTPLASLSFRCNFIV